MHLKHRLDMISAIIWLVGLWPLLLVIVTPRDLSIGEQFSLASEGDQAAYAISRIGVGLILGLAGVTLLQAMLRKTIPRAAIWIWLAYVIFFLATKILSGIGGAVPTFSVSWLYAPFIMTAIYLSVGVEGGRLLSQSKWILLVYIYVSLLAAIVVPDWALLGQYGSMLPGINFRLFGAATHANSLGALAAGYMALEMIRPSTSRWRIINLCATWMVLVLAQSKTSWGFVAILLAFFFLQAAIRVASISVATGRSVLVIGGYIIALSIGLAALAFVFDFIRFGEVGQSAGLETLTGRTYIWGLTIDVWRENLIFGYGPELWGEAFRFRYGMPYVGHAHNQYIDTLGSSGLIGLIGLLTYIAVLGRSAARCANENMIPLALLSLLVTYSFTEAPFRDQNIWSSFLLIHLLLVAHLVQSVRFNISHDLFGVNKR